MDTANTTRDGVLLAILIAPDRDLAAAFARTVPETRAFQILAELKAYPTQNTLDIRLRQLKPDVVFVDVASDLNAALALIQFVSSVQPPLPVVALDRGRSNDAVIRVLRAGAADFLAAPFEAGSQTDVIARLRRLRQPDSGGATNAAGSVVVFTAAKPGVGSSTLATHTAHAVHREGTKRVLLIDFDLEGGTAGFYLKLPSGVSVTDLMEHAGNLSAGEWASVVVNSAGVDVLTAPDLPHSDPIDSMRFHELLEFARTLYDWVIVDAPVVFHRASLMALSECNRAFLVTAPDLASLHLTRKAQNFLTQLGLDPERYRVVINRFSRKDGIDQGDIEKILNTRVELSIPDDVYALHRVTSLGQPLQSDCELGRSVSALAAELAGAKKKPEGGKKTVTVASPALSKA